MRPLSWCRTPLAALAVAAAVVAAAGCKDAVKPGSFGVNLELQTSKLPAATRARIASVTLHVSGDDPFDDVLAGAVEPAKAGLVRFHYVPKATSGRLVFTSSALGSDGAPLGGGSSGPVDLAAGRAVDATVPFAAVGNSCGGDGDCPSGHCADGVCCDGACDGACESCKLAGHVGACTAIAANQDPDAECGGRQGAGDAPDAGAPVDGGGADGGPPRMVPDGGVKVDVATCGGTCSGKRTCAYASAGTSCGQPFCSLTTESTGFSCDGTGACAQAANQCATYACVGGSCATRCTQNSDCQTDRFFCDPNSATCVPRRENGATCVTNEQCKTNVCASGFCCATACDAPNTCASPPGTCKCANLNCPSGVSCQLFYRDADADGYGDASGTIANGNAKAGCADAPPSGFIADHSDCDDRDGRVHPGQTTFYSTPSLGVGTFDYDCDGTLEKQRLEKVSSCTFCSGISSCSTATTCASANAQATVSCGLRVSCPSRFCLFFCGGETSGFTTTVACGSSGTVLNCGTCSAAGAGAPSSTFTTVQACH